MRMLPLVFVLGCTPPETDVRGPGGDADTDVDGDTDADTDVDVRDLVDVDHERELRGVWVATVANIDWPSHTGLSAAAQKAELDGIVDVASDVGLNALFFQVRSEGDAMYDSSIEPWSRYLSGTQGLDPGYDPLAYLIEKAHGKGIEVHAWLNPYRARASSSSSLAPSHMALVWPQYAYSYGGGTWMDPGAQVVEDRLVAVVVDLVDRYDVDGIHFDDYFYPYPDGNIDFPDATTYAAYTGGGGTLSKDDWRRDNVNRLVGHVHDAVAAHDPNVRFGISPFGIYRPGQPAGIAGLDQYAEIYSDPLYWMDHGYVDYLAPQLYWPHTQSAQAYGPLIDWWASHTADGHSTFAGNYLSKLGTSASWTMDEFRTQVDLTRAARADGARGNIWFSWSPIGDDLQGIRGVMRDEFHATPALPPAVAEVAGVVPVPPNVAVNGGSITCSAGDAAPVRAFVVYKDDGGFAIDRILPASAPTATLPAGRYAVTAVSLGDVQSRGLVVSIE